jgi:predicted ester cyclase
MESGMILLPDLAVLNTYQHKERNTMQRSKRFGIFILIMLLAVAALPLAPAAAQEDVAQRNKATVIDAIAKLNAGDWDGYFEMYADPFQSNEGDAVLHDENVADWTLFGKSLYGAVPDLVTTAEVIIAQGDWVAVETSSSGTFTEPFTMFGLQPTGQPVYWTEMDFYHFNADGKMDITWAYSDPTVGMPTQLGMMPPMDEGGDGGPSSETPLTTPVGYQLLSADELAASYASGNTDQSLAQFQANFDLGLGADTSAFYTAPYISWQSGTPFETTSEAGGDEFFQAIVGAMPDVTASLDVVVAEGDWVAAIGTVTGTSTNDLNLGDMWTMPPTGQSMVWQIGIIDHYNADGLITEEFIETDASPMLTAFGLMPPMDQGQ